MEESKSHRVSFSEVRSGVLKRVLVLKARSALQFDISVSSIWHTNTISPHTQTHTHAHAYPYTETHTRTNEYESSVWQVSLGINLNCEWFNFTQRFAICHTQQISQWNPVVAFDLFLNGSNKIVNHRCENCANFNQKSWYRFRAALHSMNSENLLSFYVIRSNKSGSLATMQLRLVFIQNTIQYNKRSIVCVCACVCLQQMNHTYETSRKNP